MTRRAELIRAAIEAAILEVRVALPGAVQKVNDDQTVDVLPLLKNRFIDDGGTIVQEDLPVLVSVPIATPSGGGFFASFPTAVGDTGLLIFTDFSIDQWQAKGGTTPVDPLDLRTHSLTSAVFYPGLRDSKNQLQSTSTTDMVLGKDGGSVIHIKPNGEIHVGSESAADFLAQAQKTLTELQNIVTWATSHVHPYVGLAPTAPGTTSPPVSAPSAPSSVATTKLKAD